MGIQILVIALIIMLIMTYLLFNRDILTPFFITIGMFLVSSLVAWLNVDKWGFSLSYFTILIMISMLMSFGAGAYFAKAVSRRIDVNKPQKTMERIEIYPLITLVFIFVLLLFLAKACQIIYAMSLQYGNTEGLMAMWSTARSAVLDYGANKSRLLNHMTAFAKAIGFIYCWLFLQNIVTKKLKKSDLLLGVPVILAILIQILGTLSRGFLIEWIAYIIMLYFILYSKFHGWKKMNMTRLLIIGGSALALFFVFFAMLGIMGQRLGDRSILDTIFFYTGMSIPSFDGFLTNYVSKTAAIGGETLYGIHSVMQKLGFELPEQSRHLEFISFNGTSGNVYTSLRRYINDYGILGTYIIQFYLGAFYTFFYQCLKKHSNTFLMLAYAILAHPLLMQGIDELFLSQYAAVGTVNLCIYMIFAYLTIYYFPEKVRIRRSAQKG